MKISSMKKELNKLDNSVMKVTELLDFLNEFDNDQISVSAALKILARKSSYQISWDGETRTIEYPGFTDRAEFFRAVSYKIAMHDCEEYTIPNIVFRGVRYVYTGWQPGMVFKFVGEDGSVWEGCFPEWDH